MPDAQTIGAVIFRRSAAAITRSAVCATQSPAMPLFNGPSVRGAFARASVDSAPQQAEFVALGIGEYHPGRFRGLAHIDARRAQREQPLQLLRLVDAMRVHVEVHPVLHRLRFRDRYE